MNIQIIQEFFFLAMSQGWASSEKKGMPFPEPPLTAALPGIKHGWYGSMLKGIKFTLCDYYFVAPGSDKSYGTTVIWEGERPVLKPIWVMHYGGFYKKEVIPFLKRALFAAYNKDQFFGGRGPEFYREQGNPMAYQNFVTDNCSFGLFNGTEEIRGVERKLLGEHHYFGGIIACDVLAER